MGGSGGGRCEEVVVTWQIWQMQGGGGGGGGASAGRGDVAVIVVNVIIVIVSDGGWEEVVGTYLAFFPFLFPLLLHSLFVSPGRFR